MNSFNQKIINRAKNINSRLCVGIDVNAKALGSDNFDDLKIHSKNIIDATIFFKRLIIFKFGSKAYYMVI